MNKLDKTLDLARRKSKAMSTSGHTPGPWIEAGCTVYQAAESTTGLRPDTRRICGTDPLDENEMPSDEDLLNARLIDSAPDLLAQRDELLAALKNSLAVLMETHKQARGMWNELLAAGFADKDLKMPNHDANLAAIERARLAIARYSKEDDK